MALEHEKTKVEYDEWATEFFTLKLVKGTAANFIDKLDNQKRYVDYTEEDRNSAKMNFVQKRLKVIGNEAVKGEDWDSSSLAIYEGVFGEKYE